MERYFTFFLQSYVCEVVKMMIEKYNYNEMQAYRIFVNSDTYKMLSNIELKMWEFGAPAIFDMWENEMITGTNLNSGYLRNEN